jgi:hypothetical protein
VILITYVAFPPIAVFLICWEHDPCSLYLDVMITRMGIFIRCGYGSHTGIDVATLLNAIKLTKNTSFEHVSGFAFVEVLLPSKPS